MWQTESEPPHFRMVGARTQRRERLRTALGDVWRRIQWFKPFSTRSLAARGPSYGGIPPNEWESAGERSVVGLLPGSFNPLHQGHLRLCEVAADHLGGEVAAEISIVNAEKPRLTAADVEQRCRQFTSRSVVVTAAATFAEKSRLFPGTTFIVGADTAARVVDPTFYRNDEGLMDAALQQIRTSRCSFLVAARLCADRLLNLSDLEIPGTHQSLFGEISSDDFRLDISSTGLRRGR